MQNVNFNLGEKHFEDSDFHTALDFFNLAKAEGFARPELFNYMGQCLTQLRKYDDAINCFNQAMALEPNWIRPLFNKASALIKLGLGSKALNVMNEVINCHPLEAEAHYYLGSIYDRLNDLENARKCYVMALKLDETDADIHTDLGMIYYKLNQYDQAQEHFQRALLYDPHQYQSYLGKASIQRILGQMDNAEITYLDGIESNPRNQELLLGLGKLYIEKGAYTKALDYFNEVLFMDPDNYSALKNRDLVTKLIK